MLTSSLEKQFKIKSCQNTMTFLNIVIFTENMMPVAILSFVHVFLIGNLPVIDLRLVLSA